MLRYRYGYRLGIPEKDNRGDRYAFSRWLEVEGTVLPFNFEPPDHLGDVIGTKPRTSRRSFSSIGNGFDLCIVYNLLSNMSAL